MSDKEYPGDKRGRVRIPRALIEQIVALNNALSDWADEGCGAEECNHPADGSCPFHWLDGIIEKHPPIMGIAPLRIELEIKSPWGDENGNEHWGLQGIEGAIGCPDEWNRYLPDYYWTSVHPEADKELREADRADLPKARLSTPAEDAAWLAGGGKWPSLDK
jgi:hypothetical protein